MLICQWHLDGPDGKLGEAVTVMKAWGVVNRVMDEHRCP